MPDYLTIDEVAERWRLPGGRETRRAQIYRMVRRGDIQVFRPSPRKSLFSLAIIEAFEAKGGVAADEGESSD